MNKSLVSWVMYDMANTVFNLGVVGLFLPLWVNQQQDTTDADIGFPLAISMMIVMILSPFIGAFTDQAKNRIRTFTVLNIMTATATILMGFSSAVPITLLLFATAFAAVHLAELVYNAMLTETSTPKNRGRIGGIGIGLGYLGALLVIVLALQSNELSSDYGQVLQILGGVFFALALPLTFFFIDRRNYTKHASESSTLSSALSQIRGTWKYFREYPKLSRFFTARYFYMIAVNTSSAFAVLYGIRSIGFTEREVELVMLIGILVAIPGALIWGVLVDKFGPSLILKLNLLFWILVLTGAVSIPTFNLSPQLWWGLSALVGLCYGGLWAADRPLLIQLSPRNLGEMFGVYGSVSRLSFLTGTTLWPTIAVVLDLGQPVALMALVGCLIIGLGIVGTLGNPSPIGFNDERN